MKSNLRTNNNKSRQKMAQYKLEMHLHTLGYSPCAQTDEKTFAKLYSGQNITALFTQITLTDIFARNTIVKTPPPISLLFIAQ